MRLRLSRLALYAAAGGCAACATPLPPAPAVATSPAAAAAAPRAPVADPGLGIAGYMQSVRAMNVTEIAAETQRLTQANTPLARLQGALLLTAPAHPARDEVRAQAIAEDVARSDAPGTLRDAAATVALWLADQQREQQRADTVARRATQKMREDEKRIGDLEARLRDTERRAAEAEKKPDALQRIEKEMMQKQPPANATPAPPAAKP
jgi:hypothetical protein